MTQRLPGRARRFGEVASFNIGSGLQTSGGDLQASGAAGSAANILINGDFVVDQRRGDSSAYTSTTIPANSDDTYLLDQWILLSDGNNIVDVRQEAVGTSSDIPSDGRGAIRLDVETANTKFGIFQPIENKNCKHIDGQAVSLSFKAKTSSGSTIGNLRAGIVQLSTGDEDGITSDIVNAWSVVGTDPTLVSDGNGTWTYANTPSNLALTTSYQTFEIENVTMGSLGNAGIFIWVDDTDATVGDFVFIADVQFQVGDMATEFARRPIQNELGLCQRYFHKTFQQTTIPAANAGAAGALSVASVGTGNNDIFLTWIFPAVMRAVPTIIGSFNPSAAGSNWHPGAVAIVATNVGDSSVALANIAAAVDGTAYTIHVTAISVL